MTCLRKVCQVLNNLAQNALKARKWRWQRPEHPSEEFTDDTPHVEDIEVVADRVVEQDDVVRLLFVYPFMTLHLNSRRLISFPSR
jgi:hypothetical protein